MSNANKTPRGGCASDVSPEVERSIVLEFELAAHDPEFIADNEAIEQDFAALDREVDAMVARP